MRVRNMYNWRALNGCGMRQLLEEITQEIASSRKRVEAARPVQASISATSDSQCAHSSADDEEKEGSRRSPDGLVSGNEEQPAVASSPNRSSESSDLCVRLRAKVAVRRLSSGKLGAKDRICLIEEFLRSTKTTRYGAKLLLRLLNALMQEQGSGLGGAPHPPVQMADLRRNSAAVRDRLHCRVAVYCAACHARKGGVGQPCFKSGCVLLGRRLKDFKERSVEVATVSLRAQLVQLVKRLHHALIFSPPRRRYWTDVHDGELFRDAESDDDRTKGVRVLRLLISGDGFRLKECGWLKVFAVTGALLNLPEGLRMKFENSLLLAVYAGRASVCGWREATMSRLLHELRMMSAAPFVVRDKDGVQQQYRVVLCAAITDLPGRSEMFNWPAHNAKFACSCCLHPGGYSRRARAVVFKPHIVEGTKVPFEARTNHLQLAIMDRLLNEGAFDLWPSDARIPTSLLCEMPIEGLLSDLLHVLGEGVYTRLFNKLFDSGRNANNNWSVAHFRPEIGAALASILAPTDHKKVIKSPFERLGSGFERMFLAEVVLPPLLLVALAERNERVEEFRFYMLIVTASRLMCTQQVSRQDLLDAQSLIDAAERLATPLVGDDFVTMKLHQFTHMPEQVRRMGPLPAAAMFVTENWQLQIGKHHSGPRGLAEQMLRGTLGHCRDRRRFKSICQRSRTGSVWPTMFDTGRSCALPADDGEHICKGVGVRFDQRDVLDQSVCESILADWSAPLVGRVDERQRLRAVRRVATRRRWITADDDWHRAPKSTMALVTFLTRDRGNPIGFGHVRRILVIGDNAAKCLLLADRYEVVGTLVNELAASAYPETELLRRVLADTHFWMRLGDKTRVAIRISAVIGNWLQITVGDHTCASMLYSRLRHE